MFEKERTGRGCLTFFRKGSLTVEASLIMPIVLSVVFLSLLLLLYCHNRAWYTAAAAEAVISGVSSGDESVKKGEEIMVKKLYERQGKQGFPTGDVVVSGQVEGNKYRASVYLKESQVWGLGGWNTHIDVEENIIRPVSFLRKIETARWWKGRLQ